MYETVIFNTGHFSWRGSIW